LKRFRGDRELAGACSPDAALDADKVADVQLIQQAEDRIGGLTGARTRLYPGSVFDEIEESQAPKASHRDDAARDRNSAGLGIERCGVLGLECPPHLCDGLARTYAGGIGVDPLAAQRLETGAAAFPLGFAHWRSWRAP